MEKETPRREGLLRLVRGDFEIRHGHPLPFGATFQRGGINFAIFSRHATAMTLVLFPPGESVAALELPLDPRQNRTGDVWHVLVSGLDAGIGYGFRAAKSPNLEPRIHRFDERRVLLDPYGRAVAGLESWGGGTEDGPFARLGHVRSVVIDEDFDWQGDQPLNRPLAESIIYEMHVRSFTCHSSSGVAHPGTYRGIVEKIPYLAELGITAIELMPVTEFEESDHYFENPTTGERLRNLWGYQPLSFFAPKASYATTAGAPRRRYGSSRRWCRPSTGRGSRSSSTWCSTTPGRATRHGPLVCFRGLANTTYYLLDPKDGRYLNYSGCGNTMNCNHPVVRNLVLDSLRYWVTEMHVDGFRFDLASILGRGQDGSVLSSPPLLEAIAADPILAHSKLIAEAWDAAGSLSGGQLSVVGTLGRVEREVPRRGAAVREERRGHGRVPGHPFRGQPRSLPRLRPCALPQHQLRHEPRRVHPSGPRELQREAQPRERGGRPRRPPGQPELELRGGGAVRVVRGEHAAPTPGAQPRRLAPALGGGADDPGRRRGGPYAEGQQQRLLPGQRDLVARLGASREERRPSSASSLASSASARHTPPSGARPSSRTTGPGLLRWCGTERSAASPTGPPSPASWPFISCAVEATRTSTSR